MVSFLKRKLLEHNALKNKNENIELIFLCKVDSYLGMENLIKEIDFDSKYQFNILNNYLKLRNGEMVLKNNSYQDTIDKLSIEQKGSVLLNINLLIKIASYARDQGHNLNSDKFLKSLYDYGVKLLSLNHEIYPEIERSRIKRITDYLTTEKKELCDLDRCEIRELIDKEKIKSEKKVSYKISI